MNKQMSRHATAIRRWGLRAVAGYRLMRSRLCRKQASTWPVY